jgi:hypothetical protein
MQKRMLLLLFLLSSSVVRAMEEEERSFRCFALLRSYISTWFVASQISLSPIQEAQRSKSNFEKELVPGGSFTITILRDGQTIDFSPDAFFKYCYNQNMHDSCDFWVVKIDDLDDTYIDNFNGSLLDNYKEARIDGYSALGAAILAEDVCIEYKRNLIQRLLEKGFTLTEKDKMLLALELYDTIPAEQEQMMILLLHNHQEDSFGLPHDVRKYIVDYVVRLYKEKSWLYALFQ